MAFPGDVYAPPSVYDQTEFDNPIAGALAGLKIPVFIGEGNEFLIQSNFEMIRGSSATVDQRIVQEDETGRAVVSISVTGVVTLGSYDGALDRFQVRNFPIVSGNGTGTTTNDRSDVTVTIDGNPIVVIAVDGANGIVQLAQPPNPGQLVRCTYYFNRTDTLITDDVSDQVDEGPAYVQALTGIGDVDAQNPSSPPAVLDIHGDILSSTGTVAVPANNVLILTVDGTSFTLTLPARSDYTMAQVATTISSFVANSLTASTFINNFGLSALQLNADNSVVIGNGSANAVLGLQAGQAANRVKTFYTYQGPIVDGSNGGVTTTDPANVTVRVDGIQVIPTAVDGASRAVTLPVAPAAGATVTITYWFNTWQDTFDYLANIGVVSVERVGEIPNASTFIQGADFVLQNDRILWGSALAISSGEHTTGTEYFGESQVSGLLIDNRTYMSACSAVINTSGGTAQASRTEFTLPFDPTVGNGRDTRLGQSLFQQITNNRIDLPAHRPDLVDAYWGFDVQDALDRGQVEVVKVDGIVITLKDPVPTGATVYASFYYNRLTDNEYTLTTVVPGPSGTGTYQITDIGGATVFNPTFSIGSKGTALNGIAIEFPSGSEYRPELRHEPQSGSRYTGPVSEIVTVQFESRPAGPARYVAPGSGDYEFIENQSDHLRVVVDNTADAHFVTGGHDLAAPNEHGNGYFASLVGNEIEYTGGTGAVVGQSYEYATDETVNLLIDGLQVPVTIGADPTIAKTVTYAVPYINEAASGHGGLAMGGGLSTLVLDNTVIPHSSGWHPTQDYYVGWTVVLGTTVGAATGAQSATVTAYNEVTGTITVSAPWAGGAVAAGDAYYIYNPDTMAEYKSAGRFNGSVTLTAGEYEQLQFVYYGGTLGITPTQFTGPGNLAGTYATAGALAAAVESAMNAALAAALISTPGGTHPGVYVFCSADADGRLVFKVQPSGDDPDGGALMFIDGAAAPVADATDDFAILAGIGTGANAVSPYEQTGLIQGRVARAYAFTTGTGDNPFDRIILRNRILPGNDSNSVATADAIAQMELEVQAGNGNDKLGLVTGMTGEGGDKAVVHPATTLGRVGFSGGQVTPATYGDGKDGQPIITFYDGTGTIAQNNEFSFDFDGQPVPVVFTDILGNPVAAGGSAVPVGPGLVTNTVIWQISNAMFSLPGNPLGLTSATDAVTQGYVRQEGAAIRLTGAAAGVSSALVIGTGNANSSLGFTDGAIAQRTLVSAKQTASALMSHYSTSPANHLFWLTIPDGNYFTDLAIATVETDGTGADFLYVQSLQTIAPGPGSSVQFLAAALGMDALYTGTRLLIPIGDGEAGETALDGFFVWSNNTRGSGSINTSVLNPAGTGVGQDGIVGQTYRDRVTGLTFTILPRGFLNNESGPWLAYPTGSNARFLINVTDTFVTDANLPHNALNGVELTVSNTTGVGAGDTALVETFNKGGNEPAIGDVYYATYTFQKQDYTTAFFTKVSAIEQTYGTISPNNPVSLASYLAILNGAVVVGIKQVPRAEGESYASLDTYVSAIEELEGVLPGQVNPDIITPLRGDSNDLYLVLRRSNAIQSSIRYKSERTSIIGMSSGNLPKDAITLAKLLSDSRMRLVYPDIATVSIQDALGNITEHLIDGPMLAAGLSGSVVSANTDVATPWTGRLLVGYTQLARRLDAVEQNQVAQNGVTVMEERPPFLRVRHGLTTNMENVLTKTPTIIMIADEVQRQARQVLDKFIGQKFLPGLLSQIEGRLSMMLNALVKQQIIAAYTGVNAEVAPDDPTVAEVQAYYQPVFPLLYIVLTFHLRSNL